MLTLSGQNCSMSGAASTDWELCRYLRLGFNPSKSLSQDRDTEFGHVPPPAIHHRKDEKPTATSSVQAEGYSHAARQHEHVAVVQEAIKHTADSGLAVNAAVTL
jgi:hypothetical protein